MLQGGWRQKSPPHGLGNSIRLRTEGAWIVLVGLVGLDRHTRRILLEAAIVGDLSVGLQVASLEESETPSRRMRKWAGGSASRDVNISLGQSSREFGGGG